MNIRPDAAEDIRLGPAIAGEERLHGLQSVHARPAARRSAGAAAGPGLQRHDGAAGRGARQGQPLPQPGPGPHASQGPRHVRAPAPGQQLGAGDRQGQVLGAARPAKPALQGDLHLPGEPALRGQVQGQATGRWQLSRALQHLVQVL